MAEIISLAKARKVRHSAAPSAAQAAFCRAARQMGFGDERPYRPRTPEEESEHILKMIDEIAANLGIDVEAPFRPGWRPGGAKR